MREITITSLEAGQRLDKFLGKYLNCAPKAFIYKMLRKKNIKHNQMKATGGELLLEGDVITMYLSEETLDIFMEVKTLQPVKEIPVVLYEDQNILVVQKPVGVLSHSQSVKDKDTLVDRILWYLYKKGEYNPQKGLAFTPAIANRLDRNTSGIVLCGKNLPALQELNRMIGSNKIEKYYIALVWGRLEQKGTLRDYYIKNEQKNTGKILAEYKEGAKEIVTEYEPLQIASQYTLLEVKLLTGKSHQIRLHFSSIGCPVVGDRKYGQKAINDLFYKQFHLDHQLLHANRVVFNDTTGYLSYLHQKEVVSPLPVEFQHIVNTIFKN